MEVFLKNNSLISLKEAAELSGYSPDYIGQLIRAGKIPGKQVYCNIQWMTTSGAVLDYKNKARGHGSAFLSYRWQRLKMEMEVLTLFFHIFKYALPIMLAITLALVAVAGFLFGNFDPSGRPDHSDPPASAGPVF